ncbi:MAG: OmpA family protein [Deltaproteobacteria bacterium]|nr:OmpA family protein [Kofleriaceae bacterium]
MMPSEKLPKGRGFPFRLWMYAILMTAAAGGLGYFAFKLRGDNERKDKEFAACATALPAAQRDAAAYVTCKSDLEAVSARQKENDEALAKMQSNLSATKDELTALRQQRIEAEKRLAAIQEIQGQFAKMIRPGELEVVARKGSLVVQLPAEVLFQSGSAEISQEGEYKVVEVGVILKRFPDRRFLVVGHTDNIPLKSATMKDNWELSMARALTVTRVLVKAGMDPKRLIPAGSGEFDPVSGGDDIKAGNAKTEDRARNRRIEIVLLPALAELPPLPESLPGTKPAESAPAAP